MARAVKRETRPILDSLFWSDGVQVVALDAPAIEAWLDRGVSRGWVVAARSAEKALEIVHALPRY
jgi:hypothetical protein